MRTGGTSARSGPPANRSRASGRAPTAAGDRRSPAIVFMPRARDLRGVEPRDHSRLVSAGEDRCDDRRAAPADAGPAAGLVLKRGSSAELGLLEHVGAEPRPLARVLDRRGRPVRRRRVANGTVRRDRRVMRAAARRRGAAVAGVVRRRAHPLAERVEERHVERRCRRPVGRAREQRRRGCRSRRTCRRRCRRPRCRRVAGDRPCPVIDSRPTSLCTSRS